MKVRLFISLMVIGISLSFHSYSQGEKVVKEFDYKNFQFKGFKEEKTIYQYNPLIGSSSKVGKRFELYYSNLSSSEKVNFHLYRKYDNYVYYIHENYILFGKSNPDSLFLNKDNHEIDAIKKIGEMNYYQRTHYLTTGHYFYFSTEIGDIDYLARIDITQEKPKMEVLPIKGRKPILYKNWLFYEIDYVSPKYSDPPESIYRVRIGDWRNPELVVNDVYSVGTVVNENIISFRIYLDKEMKHITYNMSDSTYIEKGISSLIKYKGKKYQRTLCKNPETGKIQLCFKDLPELPEDFPHKLDRDIEANHNYFHLPHTEKPFTGTFITDSLMFFADKEELQKLSKPQLRKLRNAFYAREGYDFSSQDLKDFFSQYEWYINTLERRKAFDLTNDEIYMPPANMERIRLIQSVEKSK
jgi:hypothetical protein